MGRRSKKGDALALTINPAAFVEAVAEQLFVKIEAKFGKRLSRHEAPPPVEQEFLSIGEFATKTGTSSWFIRKLIREGTLVAVKVGDLLKIHISVANEFIASRPAARSAGASHRKPPPRRGAIEPATAPRPPRVEMRHEPGTSPVDAETVS
jgi:excisionase family DNA binding protein